MESSQPQLHEGISAQRILVEEDKLRELFTPGCGAAIDPSEVILTYTGTVAHVTATCNSNHSEFWDSSSSVGEGHGKRFVTNILMV